MKRILFIAISGLLLAVGCQRESAESGLSGEVITASFSVSLPIDMDTKAISDGTGATELVFLAYDADDHHLERLDQTVTVDGNKASLSVTLVAGTGYKFVFWAQAPGKYTVAHDSDGHPVVTIAATTLPDMMNNDAYDAFYAVKAIGPQDSNFIMDVSLSRPFAQLNLAVNEADYTTAAAGYDLASLFQTSFSVKGVPSAIDLFTGKVSGEMDVTYSPATAPADIITSGQKSYRRIAMVYVLAPAEQPSSHDVTLTSSVGKKGNGGQLDIQNDIPNVPLKRNFRTNLLGDVFSVGGTFNVQVDSDFGTPDNTVDLAPTPIPEPDAIDLGLPSGLLWASFNVGATKPEEPGNYYAWGETVTKDSYNWSNYKWCKGTSASLTRYCTSDAARSWGGEGDPDGKTTFKDYDYDDDVARQLLGGSWRTPTKEEWEELLSESTHTADYYYGPNGQSILLPNTGFQNAVGLNNTDEGYYWSSSLQDPGLGNSSAAWYMNNHNPNMNTGGRSFGLAIRAVKMAEP